jgi:ABC-type dipeptide/oligopeptide/nickel transport system ATPase subunit
MMGLYPPTSGTITFAEGCRTQMIFQDSASAFDPRLTLAQIIAEPLVINHYRAFGTGGAAGAGNGRRLSRREIRQMVLALMEQVELSPDLADRHPYDVSGGERQRAAIARALITEPDLLIADEPISSLDVSTQAQIIHLLKRLQEKRGLSILLIAHDLPMVLHVSDRVLQI